MVVLISLVTSALLAIIFGIIILVWPKSLNLAVAVWLILYGVLGLIAQYY